MQQPFLLQLDRRNVKIILIIRPNIYFVADFGTLREKVELDAKCLDTWKAEWIRDRPGYHIMPTSMPWAQGKV